MNPYQRRMGGAGPSKANSNTLCQKCLKKGHYSYECKEPRTERPYVSRPSRTQQLLNPKLLPKLMSDQPNELLRKTGIADEQLAKKEQERARNRDDNLQIDGVHSQDEPSKRARARSSSASSRSVSSYSTDRSDSRSPPLRRNISNQPPRGFSMKLSTPPRMGSSKRRRSVSHSDEDDERHASGSERRTRRRISDASPETRGRRRSPDRGRSSRQASRSPGRRGSDHFRREKEPEQQQEMNLPRQTGAHSNHRHDYRQRNDNKYSNPQARVAKDDRGRRMSNDDERYGASHRPNDSPRRSASPPLRPPQPPRERSISPFSKRLALTQAMNRSGQT